MTKLRYPAGPLDWWEPAAERINTQFHHAPAESRGSLEFLHWLRENAPQRWA